MGEHHSPGREISSGLGYTVVQLKAVGSPSLKISFLYLQWWNIYINKANNSKRCHTTPQTFRAIEASQIIWEPYLVV